MKFIADFHVHSKFSRATAKNLDLEHLYIAAQQKGITVVGTGDFTHPAWFSELKEKLVPAEDGLFRLREDMAILCDKEVPAPCRREVRFILTAEISNIYKKTDKTRKNHNLIFVPDLNTAAELSRKLDAIGNIKSDGRPILGLDARNLLELLLETSERSFLIPAHIWTPWFSLLGSKSGFDSIEECFEDLTPHIFAVETGLSSDPEMNWRISGLDGITLVSNSDAHSPSKLGREANIFDTGLSYAKIKSALKDSDPARFLGTFEFYPEEGKYHLDGHRKCNVRLLPRESLANDGLCPVCGKPLTLGVMHRVEALADRSDGIKAENRPPFYSIIPLEEILSEILNVGPNSFRVQQSLTGVLNKIGSEFNVLHHSSIEELNAAGIPLLGEAIQRMRTGKVQVSAGYDGEYGKIKVFKEGERERLFGQKSLFILPESPSLKMKDRKLISEDRLSSKTALFKEDSLSNRQPPSKPVPQINSQCDSVLLGLNSEQKKAVMHEGSPLVIVAGPGTGKTLTLTRRIAYLIKEKGVSPQNILAVTFTNKAAQEMEDRLKILTDDLHPSPIVATFHGFCFQLLKEMACEKNDNSAKGIASIHTNFLILDDSDQLALIDDALRFLKDSGCDLSLTSKEYMKLIASAKQKIFTPYDNLDPFCFEYGYDHKSFQAVYRSYQDLLNYHHAYDYEDLILNVVKILEEDPSIRLKYQTAFRYIFVDEYQDLNHGQYRIIKSLAPRDKEICVIGDPDQSIYGFRGSDPKYFKTFVSDYPNASMIHLTQNYRSTETILEASYQVIRQDHSNETSRLFSEIDGLKTIGILELETEKSEAVAIGKIIEQMVGGMGYYSVDFGKLDASGDTRQQIDPKNMIRGDKTFSDFAVLFRTGAQAKIFADVFDAAGIPFQQVSREDAYGRKGIAELIAYLKVISGYGSIFDFERIIRLKGSGVSSKTFEMFKKWMYLNQISLNKALLDAKRFPIPEMPKASQRKLDELIRTVHHLRNKIDGLIVEKQLLYLMENIPEINIAITNHPKTLDVFKNLLHVSSRFQDRISDFFGMIAMNTDTDIFEYDAEKVSLLTMHAAKGLEFPVVFIAGCEENLIPYRKIDLNREKNETHFDIREERRLFYVALTRAKEVLYLTYSKKRRIYGKHQEREISPFVKDIEHQLLSRKTFSRIKKEKQSIKETQIQLELF